MPSAVASMLFSKLQPVRRNFKIFIFGAKRRPSIDRTTSTDERPMAEERPSIEERSSTQEKLSTEETPSTESRQSTKCLPRYTYASLPAQGYIRLMRLFPGQHDDALVCSLFDAELDTTPPYEAISYVWGLLNQERCPLMCGGGVLQITPNLHDALRRMRQTSEERVLWVDAVCIDQQNIPERGHQVNLMGHVYASACRVLIWLGEGVHGDAEDAFSLIIDVNRHFGNGFIKYGVIDKVPSLPPGSPLLLLSRWQAVKRLLDHEWFSRVWVLQEVGLAAKALAFCGKSSINWSEIVEFACICSRRRDLRHWRIEVNLQTGFIYDAYKDLWSSYGNSRSWKDELPYVRYESRKPRNSTRREIFYTLFAGSDFKAIDPRDKIFDRNHSYEAYNYQSRGEV